MGANTSQAYGKERDVESDISIRLSLKSNETTCDFYPELHSLSSCPCGVRRAGANKPPTVRVDLSHVQFEASQTEPLSYSKPTQALHHEQHAAGCYLRPVLQLHKHSRSQQLLSFASTAYTGLQCTIKNITYMIRTYFYNTTSINSANN